MFGIRIGICAFRAEVPMKLLNYFPIIHIFACSAMSPFSASSILEIIKMFACIHLDIDGARCALATRVIIMDGRRVFIINVI